MPARIKASFPDLDWPDQAIITVDAGDTGAVITSWTIHLAQDVPEELVPEQPFVPLFVYGAAQ